MDYTRNEAKPWAQANLHGFHDAPLTPFTRDGEVDAPALRHNIDAFVDMGMEGIVVGGFIGEAWNLTLSEWMRYHELVADANAGRMKSPPSSWTLGPPGAGEDRVHAHARLRGGRGHEPGRAAEKRRRDLRLLQVPDRPQRHGHRAVPHAGVRHGAEPGADAAPGRTSRPWSASSRARCAARTPTNCGATCADDFFVSEPMEQYFLDDLRLDYWFVQWAAFHYTVFGKLRPVIRQYMADAAAGNWAAAQAKWLSLRAASGFIEDMTVWELARTGTYASAFTMLKPWYDADRPERRSRAGAGRRGAARTA